MKQYYKNLLLLLVLGCSFGIAKAQDNNHWSYNPHVYEYEMAVYFTIEYNDKPVTDWGNYEVAAICGEECRGVGEILSVTLGNGQSVSFGYMRIRSNQTQGENISLKVYDKSLDMECHVTETIAFKAHDLIGMPSSPMKFTFYDERPVTVKVKSYSRIYGEENPVFEYIVEGPELIGVPEIACEAGINSPVGEYPILASRGSIKNVNTTFVNGTLIITQAPGSISYRVSEVSKTYGDAPFTNELIHVGDGIISYSSSNDQVATVDADGLVTITGSGTATITATVADGTNYAYAVKTASFDVKVAKADMSVTATGYNGTYDGLSHGITVEAPEGAAVMYGESEGNYTSESSFTYTSVGTRTVYYEVTKPHYHTVTGSQNVTIVPKTIGLLWGETSFDCDGTEKQPMVVVTELVEGDECTATVEGSGVAVGSYTATVTGLSNANYQLPTDGVSCPFVILRDITSVFSDGCRWATYVAQEDLAVPSGLKAYIVSNVTKDVVMGSEIDYIPTGTGILLQRNDVSESGYKGEAYTGVKETIESKLVGNATTSVELKPFKDFVLYRDEFVLSSTTTAAAGRAYLPAASVPAGARSLTISTHEGATAIVPITVNDQKETWYDIVGRKLDRKPTTKGLFINNGKKVLIK